MDVEIYNRFAHRYDLVTNLASLGIEPLWRRLYVKKIKEDFSDGVVADVATATGELVKLLCFSKNYLIDPSEPMLQIAKQKLEKSCPGKEFHYLQTTAEEVKLPEPVDIISAFMALRNFDNLEQGVENLTAQLKPGGRFYVVEMVNTGGIFANLSLWYIKNIVPVIGKVLAGKDVDFSQLGESIQQMTPSRIVNALRKSGLQIVERKKLFPPTAILIVGEKRAE
jgi:ubiquinone/menaquinone biosynthesis methyltransferase